MAIRVLGWSVRVTHYEGAVFWLELKKADLVHEAEFDRRIPEFTCTSEDFPLFSLSFMHDLALKLKRHV